MNITKITQLGALSFAMCAATSFAASNDALLEILVKKGVLTSAEAEDVRTELAAAEAEAAKDQPVYVQAKGKAVESIKLTGRFHFAYDNISNDGDYDERDRFYFRRLYLGAEAKFAHDTYAKLIGNFGGEDGDIDLDKAVVGWKADPMFEVEAGYTKVPFGLYETTSSSKIKTVERSIANRLFVEDDGLRLGGRHTGLFAEGDLGAGFSYGAAAVTSSPSNDRDDKSNAEKDGLGFFGRVQWESDETEVGEFMVGADLAHMENGSNYTNDGSGGNSGDGDLTAFGIHGSYDIGDFTISAEGLFGTVEDQIVAGDDVDVTGFTITPSYKITDKWEIVAAYSVVDTDGGFLLDADDLVRRSGVGETFDEGTSYYLGFNYYIIGNDLKLSGGYEFAEFEDGDGGADDVEIDAFRLRLQALF
ncbi:MAG: hypothetical protein HRT56_09320 [Coraliomargarita sp.]|nr:hypothetical protein [Coraliomargarita sp.]